MLPTYHNATSSYSNGTSGGSYFAKIYLYPSPKDFLENTRPDVNTSEVFATAIVLFSILSIVLTVHIDFKPLVLNCQRPSLAGFADMWLLQSSACPAPPSNLTRECLSAKFSYNIFFFFIYRSYISGGYFSEVLRLWYLINLY